MRIDAFGSGPDLILIHGWAMHGGIFAPLAPLLAEHFRVHAVDLPGHGRSIDSDESIDPARCAAHLAARLPRAIWAGWSYGGLVSLHAALDFPLWDRLDSVIKGFTNPSELMRRCVLQLAHGGSAQTADHQADQQNFFSFARQDAAAVASGGTAAGGHTAGTPLNSMSSWAQALAERVLEMQKHKQSQLTLEVESKDLGRVLLRVETENNQVRATISTESEQARNMLHRGAPELRQQLESQSRQVTRNLRDSAFVEIVHGDQHAPPGGQRSAGGHFGLGKGMSKVAGMSHHFAGGAHLRTESHERAWELVEWQHHFFDEETIQAGLFDKAYLLE